MLALAASSWLYFACVAFFHADTRRTDIAMLKQSKATRSLLWGAGGVAALLALFPLQSLSNWELAIPIWLGIGVFVGALSLLISAFAKSWHFQTGLVGAIVGIISSGAALLAGGGV